MLEEFISNQYLRALAVLVGTLLIFRFALFIFFLIAQKAASKTKTNLDDLLINKSRWPLTFWLFFISLRISLEQLVLSDPLSLILSKSISTLIILNLAYVLFLVLDIIIFNATKKFITKTKTQIDDGLVSIIQNTLKIALIVISILYILDFWGVQVGPFLAGLGIAGLAIALALQPILSNIFSGVSMILDKTVRVGDLVYIDADTKGVIESVGFRSTKIRTFDNELIIIPNTKLAESKIQNVSLPEPKSRVVIPFSVAYGSNIEKVKKLILREVSSISKVCKSPEPVVRFIEMAESSLNFKLYFFVSHYDDRWPSIDEANTKIYNALNKNKIEIPYPHLDINIRKK
ncbi:MAG: mechanosensitive ion channel family protein [Nanoarchaeota archaeon]